MKEVVRLADKPIKINIIMFRDFLDHHSYPNSAVPVRFVHARKFTVCMPSGNTILSTAPAEGRQREEKGESEE